MSRPFVVELPELDFSPADLGPPTPAPTPPQDAEPGDTAYAQMLPAGGADRDEHGQRLLVTVHVDDTEGVLLDLLALLADPQDVDSVPGLQTFTVEASVSASLAGVGAIAIVVQPRFDPADTELAPEQLRRLTADLAAWLRTGLAAGLRDRGRGRGGGRARARGAGTVDPVIDVQSIEPGDERALYTDRHFREMRFGIDMGDPGWAATCARLITRFSAAIGSREVPLAYLHFPLLWDSPPQSWAAMGGSSVRWLRMAYAVPSRRGDASVESGIELDAWGIADDEGVGLAAYEPTIEGALEDRFVLLTAPPARQVAPPSDAPTTPDAPDEAAADTPVAVALGVEVQAKAGLLAEVMSDLPDARVYGCTVAVLYGQTLCNIVVDEATSLKLTQRLRSKAGGVAPHPVEPRVRVVRQSDDQDFGFWVAWCCGDRPGVMRAVLQAVRNTFRRENLEMPNVNYAISRVLADGRTCAGKAELILRREEAVEMGLLAPGHQVGERADETMRGWRNLRAAVGRAVSPALADWEPQTAAWLEHPVAIGDAEPSEQPWALLVVPEGTADESEAASGEQWALAGDILQGLKWPYRRSLGLSTLLAAADRLFFRWWAPPRNGPGRVSPPSR